MDPKPKTPEEAEAWAVARAEQQRGFEAGLERVRARTVASLARVRAQAEALILLTAKARITGLPDGRIVVEEIDRGEEEDAEEETRG